MSVVLSALSLLVLGCSGSGNGHVHDEAGILPARERALLERQAALLERESGLDLHFLLRELAPGTRLDEFAVEAFRELAVGSSDGRGLLFVYDATAGVLRIEVGYALEGIFPDSFVGELIDRHARQLFAADDPAMALRLALRMLHDRLRRAQLEGRFDPTSQEARAASLYGSGGGGARAAAPLGRDPLPQWSASREEAPGRFAAGETVEATYPLYLEWLGDGSDASEVGLLTPGSRELLSAWPVTPAYLDYVRAREIGRKLEVEQRGDRALLYSTDDPLLEPHFWRRTRAGWQLDLAAETREIIDIRGGRYSWSFVSRSTPFLAPFADRIVSVEGILRLAGGANRPLTPFRRGP